VCDSRRVSRIDHARFEGQPGRELAARFRTAEPFPHVVLPDLVPGDPAEIEDAFPDQSWSGWDSRTSEYQPGKWSCRNIDVMPAVLRDLILDLSGPRFLQALSTLTAIDGLLPDPYLEGGGLQYSEAGGELLPHTDFHYHPTLPLFRRINVLLYLNDDWEPGDGGELVLFDLGDDTPRVTVQPRFGTCVMFATDHRSVHGVNLLTGSGRRRSIALYYYTIDETDVFSGDRRTYWYPPKKAGARDDVVGSARLKIMQSALRASKALTRIAYRVDPQKPDLV
jgi:hypothetical protein